MKTIIKAFSFSLIFMLIVDGLYINMAYNLMLQSRDLFSFSSVALALFQLFILYFLLLTTITVVKDNLADAKLEERKEFVLKYSFPSSVEEEIIRSYPKLTEAQRAEIFEYLRLFFIDNLMRIYYVNTYGSSLKKPFKKIEKGFEKKEKVIQETLPDFSFEALDFEELMEQTKQEFFSNAPSMALNRAWNAFSITNGYKAFCDEVFEIYFSYTPLLTKGEGQVIRFPNEKRNFIDIWESFCLVEEIDPFFPQSFPSIFTLDTRLAIPDAVRFEIDEVALREELSIANAPSPDRLITEIEEGAYSEYMAKKLQYYLTNIEYCGLYQEQKLKSLLTKIQHNDTLGSMVFGTYTDAKVLMKNVLKNAAPSEDIGSSSGVSL